MSNESVLVSLLQNARTCSVKFTGSEKSYTYKVPEGMELAEGDLAVVDAPSAGYTIVKVTKVHDESGIDIDAQFRYKWLVSKVDTASYTALLEKEAQMEADLKKLRSKVAVKKQIKSLLGELDGEDLPEALQGMKEWL